MLKFPVTGGPKTETISDVDVTTKITLYEDGRLLGETHSIAKSWTGAHIVVMIALYDQQKNLLWCSNEHRCGVAGGELKTGTFLDKILKDPTGQSDRKCTWDDRVPSEILMNVYGYVIIQKDKGGSDTLDWLKSLAESYVSKNEITVIEKVEKVTKQSVNFTNTGQINKSVINLGTISGQVTNTINQLPDAPTQGEKSIKELLVELQKAIESDSELKESAKADGLEKVKNLAEIANNLQKPNIQNGEKEQEQQKGKEIIEFFKGVVKFLPDTAKIVGALTTLLPLISKALGFG